MTIESIYGVEGEVKDELIKSLNTFQSSGNAIWMLITGFLVFWMHAGFTMLEAGSVTNGNAINILFKNIGTISIGAVCYYFLGYGFAYGTNESEPMLKYIGAGNFANAGLGYSTSLAFFFFQFAFAATAATIVSGAVAGRVALPAYFGIVVFLTAFVYPVVSHVIWQVGGWLSAFNGDAYPTFMGEDGGCGVIDFAGSGVVHMTGGVAAFWAALFIGPRLGRFSEGGDKIFAPHNVSLQTLGVFTLWFGWYGFNCGSTLAWNGPVAAKAAVTTTLSPAAAVCTAIILSRVVKGYFDIGDTLNAALAGLVSITAGCSVVDDGYAILIGAIGAVVYMGASKLMKLVKIDDPVDAIAVHGFAGIWGLLAAGIFATDNNTDPAYGLTGCNGGTQIATQLVGAAFIIGWVSACMIPVILVLKFTGLLRVPAEIEESGLDESEHGGRKVFYDSDA